MSKEQKPDTGQQQFWQMVIETWQSSGLSVRNFCKQEGLSEPAFYAWRKKLNKSNEPKDTNSSAFIKVSMLKDNPAPLELVLSSGNSLRISSHADSQTLSDVITVLHKAGLC